MFIIMYIVSDIINEEFFTNKIYLRLRSKYVDISKLKDTDCSRLTAIIYLVQRAILNV